MRPCNRCCAAIGNADDRCPRCGALQPRSRRPPQQWASSDLPPEAETEDDDGEGLIATLGLCGLGIVLLSVLAFGGSGVFVAMGLSLVCWIVLGAMTSGCV